MFSWVLNRIQTTLGSAVLDNFPALNGDAGMNTACGQLMRQSSKLRLCAILLSAQRNQMSHFRNDNVGLDDHNKLVIIFQSVVLFDDSWNKTLFQLNIVRHTHTT